MIEIIRLAENGWSVRHSWHGELAYLPSSIWGKHHIEVVESLLDDAYDTGYAETNDENVGTLQSLREYMALDGGIYNLTDEDVVGDLFEELFAARARLEEIDKAAAESTNPPCV